MIKYLLISFLFLTSQAFAAPKVMLKFNDAKVKQGGLVDAVIGLNSETTQKIQYNQLKGQTLGGSFYIYQAKPLMTKGSWDTLESEAKIIVVKIPENRPLVHKLGNDSIEVDWNQIEFIPTEVPKSFIFGQFEVPSKANLILWASILMGVIFIGFLGYIIFKKLKAKNALKNQRKAFKESLTNVSDYSGVVAIWQKKSQLIKEFPHLEEHFKFLETTLFKYQFKPYQNEEEKNDVMRAYKEFLSKSEGGFRGI